MAASLLFSAFCSKNAAFYLKGDYGLENSLALHAMTKRLVILSAKRERIRNTLKRVTDYSRLPIRLFAVWF